MFKLSVILIVQQGRELLLEYSHYCFKRLAVLNAPASLLVEEIELNVFQLGIEYLNVWDSGPVCCSFLGHSSVNSTSL